VLATPTNFLIWAGICAASYSGLSGSNAAAVSTSVPPEHAGFYIGLLGFVDTGGMSVGPLFLNLFGVGDSGAAAGDAGARARGVLALPTALLLVGHAVRVVRAQRERQRMAVVLT
jgi:MFS family permease